MRKRVVIVLFMLLAVAALLFIVSCPDELTDPKGQGGSDEPELTIEKIAVVDGGDGFSPVLTPEVGQVIRANVELSDGTFIYTHPKDNRVTYEWYYVERSETILGTEGSYTVTSDNIGNTIGVKVTVEGIGEDVWEAASPLVIISELEIVDTRGNPVTVPKVDYTIGANIKLSDDTYIYPHSDDNRISYEWYHTDDDQEVLGTSGSYTITESDIDKKLGVRISITGIGSTSWEAEGKVLEPVLYNVAVTGTLTVDPIEITLTDDNGFGLVITGPPDTQEGGLAFFEGDVVGTFNGVMHARVNTTHFATIYATITGTDATDDVRFIGYLSNPITGEITGEIITGPPLEPVTSIVVKDDSGNSEDLSVVMSIDKELQLVATTSPEGATNEVLWSIEGGGDNIIDEDGLFTANVIGETTVIVKTYDDSNLSEHEVTITVTN